MTHPLFSQLLPENRDTGIALWDLLELLIDYDCAHVANQTNAKDFNPPAPQKVVMDFGLQFRNAIKTPPDFYPYSVEFTIDPSVKPTEHKGILKVTYVHDGPVATFINEVHYAITMPKLKKLLPQLEHAPNTGDLMIAMLDVVGGEEYDIPKDDTSEEG